MNPSHVIASAAKQSQSGFSLLEVSVAMMVVAAVTLGYLYNQSRQSAVSLARTQAGYYQVVSAAVSQYMASNYSSLKGKSDACSVVPLITDSSAPPTFSGCGIDVVLVSGATSSVKPIANGLQPSLSELTQAGYLPANFSNGFLWPTAQVMKTNASDFAASEFRVQIQRWCNSAVSNASNSCDAPDLRSLVYNAQPFAKESSSGFISFSRLDKLFEARNFLGANGLVAYDYAFKNDGVLYSEGDKFKLPNPLRFTSGSPSGVGLEGVLALQSLYQIAKGTTPVDPPTPPPPPPPIDDRVVKALPFSECDPITHANTVAYASDGSSRVAPVPDMSYEPAKCLYNPKVSRPTDYVHFPVFQGSAMTCRRNDVGTNYTPNCKLPAAWRTCVTALEHFDVSPKDRPYSDQQWVRRKAHDDLSKKSFCWQPVVESYFGFNGNIDYVYGTTRTVNGVQIPAREYTPWDVKTMTDTIRSSSRSNSELETFEQIWLKPVTELKR